MTLRTLLLTAVVLLLLSGAAAQEPTVQETPAPETTAQETVPPRAETCDECLPECPTDLEGYAPETGGVFMSWTVNSKHDIQVYRAVGGGDFEPLERLEFPATRYIDLDTEPGVTYRYQVTAVGATESEACDMIEVTTVPVFSAWWTGPVVAAAGLMGYLLVTRRTS